MSAQQQVHQSKTSRSSRGLCLLETRPSDVPEPQWTTLAGGSLLHRVPAGDRCRPRSIYTCWNTRGRAEDRWACSRARAARSRLSAVARAMRPIVIVRLRPWFDARPPRDVLRRASSADRRDRRRRPESYGTHPDRRRGSPRPPAPPAGEPRRPPAGGLPTRALPVFGARHGHLPARRAAMVLVS